MRSCLYEGVVAHRRRSPLRHAFRRSLCMAFLDLHEAGELAGPRGMISSRRFALRSFLPSDHLFGDTTTLAEGVRVLVRGQTGEAPRGPVRLLTQLRHFGQYFSPLNLFFLYDPSGERVECVVAEVNNTPWGERCCYVLDARQSPAGAGVLRFSHNKAMHVSPFMPMGLRYVWRMTPPGERVSVALACEEGSDRLFDAALVLRRRPLSRANLRRATLRYPAMGVQTLAAIHYQALKLWWKRCPFYPHPNTQSKPTPSGLPSR